MLYINELAHLLRFLHYWGQRKFNNTSI